MHNEIQREAGVREEVERGRRRGQWGNFGCGFIKSDWQKRGKLRHIQMANAVAERIWWKYHKCGCKSGGNEKRQMAK